MSNKPIIMSKIRQIIRCHCQGIGSKRISSMTGVSRNTIKTYIKKFAALGLTLGEIDEKSELELQALLFPPVEIPTIPDVERFQHLQSKIPDILKALRKKGMTIDIQWLKYINEYPNGYSRTRFYYYLVEHKRKGSSTMHFEHKAGEKMFVDYCGDKLKVVDIQTGELKELEVFVAILGCSQLTFIEASLSQTKEDFIDSCRRALEYFGGVPKAIVPDNLKSAVTKSSKYEPIINEAFASFAEHYNTVVLPARAYKPKDKALVENAVRLVYQRIYTAFETPILFESFEQVNRAIKEPLEVHNSAPLKQGESRRVIFETEEKDVLLTLPEIPYELLKFKECTVMKNGHVSLHEDRHYYSVPFEFIGKKVKLQFNSLKVDVYYHYKLIASHQRNYRRNRYTTNVEHMASKHKFMSEWNPEYFIEKAKDISEETAMFIERLLGSKAHPEQGYKACNGVLNLAKRVGQFRITNACKRALEYEAIHYNMLEDILKKGLDKISPEEESLLNTTTPEHRNVRGKEYYQTKIK
jgi:transposase